MRRGAATIALLAALAAACAGTAPACAGDAPAPADSALQRYLGGLADSTDAYFGIAVAPIDTAGLDSALAVGLASRDFRRPARARLELAPWLGFERVSGPVYGGRAHVGAPDLLGRAGGSLGYAVGQKLWLGDGTLEKSRPVGGGGLSLRLAAGRWIESVDRDAGEPVLSQIRAFLFGTDTQHYLRRDGVDAHLEYRTEPWRAAVAYRNRLDSPLASTATWDLFNTPLEVVENVPATPGRSSELEAEAIGALPLALRTDLDLLVSAPEIGSDFDYTRYRLALVGDYTPARWISVVPQAVYGRTLGAMTPQSAFYIGGSYTLRSLLGDSRGGTGLALARLNLVGWKDLLGLVGLPSPEWLKLQPSALAGVGAVWGEDPYGGPRRAGDAWPTAEQWLPEAGVGMLWRPGLPDPSMYWSFTFVWGLGQNPEGMRALFSVTRPIDLLRPRGE